MTNYFAKNLKYYRLKNNIEQQKMAKDLKIGQSTLSGWENGTRTPNLDMIVKIGKYLNIYEDYITKDLTNEKEKSELQKLLDDNIDKLSNSDKNIIKTIIEERINNNK